MYERFGDLIDVYKGVSVVWKKIEEHLTNIDPSFPSSLTRNVAVCGKEDVAMPVELRCLLSMWNGQQDNDQHDNTQKTTFLGVLKAYDYCNDFSIDGFHLFKHRKHSLMFLAGKGGGHWIAVYLGTTSSNQHPSLKAGNVIAVNESDNMTYYFLAHTVLDFLKDFLKDLDENKMPIHNGILYRFWDEGGGALTTRGVSIRVFTSYLFELSSHHCHVFAYLVQFKMATDAGEEEACRLETRMWEVESGRGGINRVQGDGVIGEYPVFKPGSDYIYSSCTNIYDSSATMRGYYTVKNLFTNSRYRLQIPEFHMKIPDLKYDLK